MCVCLCDMCVGVRVYVCVSLLYKDVLPAVNDQQYCITCLGIGLLGNMTMF